jgi:phosphonate transport system permease protein
MAASDTTDRRLAELMAAASARARLETGRNLILAVAFLALVGFTYNRTEFSLPALVTGAHNMTRILAGFAHPDPAPLQLVLKAVAETLETAILGTTIGAVIAVPLSFVAARNLMGRNPAGTGVYLLVRMLMSVIRAVPTLFWGLLFVTAIGIGPFPGVLAVTVFSIGLMSKLFSEAIEAIDWGQVEALTATGATPVQVVVNGVFPQVTPYMIAHLLYTFEVNVHSATILGIVGAGGIGFLFFQYIEQFQYSQEATVLIVVVLMTMIIDYSSAAVRRRII